MYGFSEKVQSQKATDKNVTCRISYVYISKFLLSKYYENVSITHLLAVQFIFCIWLFVQGLWLVSYPPPPKKMLLMIWQAIISFISTGRQCSLSYYTSAAAFNNE